MDTKLIIISVLSFVVLIAWGVCVVVLAVTNRQLRRTLEKSEAQKIELLDFNRQTLVAAKLMLQGEDRAAAQFLRRREDTALHTTPPDVKPVEVEKSGMQIRQGLSM